MDKTLLFDIETAPNVAYVWGKWEQNVIEFVKEWEILSFAYKWLGVGNTVCITRNDFRDKTDKTITKVLWSLLDEADVLVAHNGDQFDVKKVKAKFLEHGFCPPSPFKTIDTKKIAKSLFSFNSNSLDDLGKTLGVGRKVKHEGFSLWLKCMRGDNAAWKRMAQYNKQDVCLLEKVYLAMRAWGNPAHIYRDSACPSCGSKDYQHRGRDVFLKKKQRAHCNKCGRWFSF